MFTKQRCRLLTVYGRLLNLILGHSQLARNITRDGPECTVEPWSSTPAPGLSSVDVIPSSQPGMFESPRLGAGKVESNASAAEDTGLYDTRAEDQGGYSDDVKLEGFLTRSRSVWEDPLRCENGSYTTGTWRRMATAARLASSKRDSSSPPHV